MINNFKNARLQSGMRANEVAKHLGVAGSTVSSWEASRMSPTLDKLVAVADLYGVSIDYLLGRQTAKTLTEVGEEIKSKEMLNILHRKPVFTKRGWALVNAIEQELVFADGNTIPFSDIDGAIRLAPESNEENINLRQPLTILELKSESTVFIEPIGMNRAMLSQLRGEYKLYIEGGFAENNKGNRFFFDTYSVDWFAYRSFTI